MKYLSLLNFKMVCFLLECRRDGLDDLLVELSALVWEQYANLPQENITQSLKEQSRHAFTEVLSLFKASWLLF